MGFWKTIQNEINEGEAVALLYVIDSKGSSPGRQGFKMWVSTSNKIQGSIGGGIMEHKLVELCKSILSQGSFSPFIKKQIHKDGIPNDKSGMICSGEQIVAFYYFDSSNSNLLKSLAINDLKRNGSIEYSHSGVVYSELNLNKSKFELEIKSQKEWHLNENLSFEDELHIVGGGHISLALSEFAVKLGFRVIVYDDRPGLNTMILNEFAPQKEIVDFSQIGSIIPEGENKYVVLVSFGYRIDKIILRQLLDKNYAYLGMMGSRSKVDQLYQEYLTKGISSSSLDHVYAPIGLDIGSKTPNEIAISILAEIIKVRNYSL